MELGCYLEQGVCSERNDEIHQEQWLLWSVKTWLCSAAVPLLCVFVWDSSFCLSLPQIVFEMMN